MNSSEELLQRCFDNDLNDTEMRTLFTTLSTSVRLREEFRSFQTMRMQLLALNTAVATSTLDRRIETLPGRPQEFWHAARLPVRRLFSKRIRVPVLAMIVAAAVLLFSSMIAAIQLSSQQPVTQYVYVYELQPVVVQSHFIQ
jgi:hypothetical protein